MSESSEVFILDSVCAAHMEDINGKTATCGQHHHEQQFSHERCKKKRDKPHPCELQHDRQHHSVRTVGRQHEKEFLAHKKRVMSNLSSNACDHSPKGAVDRNCLPIMHLLNEHRDYVTTSSCGGRIALFHSVVGRENSACRAAEGVVGMKRGDKDALGWLVVKHGLLTEEEMDVIVRSLCGKDIDRNVSDTEAKITTTTQILPQGNEGGELGGVWVQTGVLNPNTPPRFGLVALKMEPFVMHVECRTMEAAKQLLTAAASDSGFRNSGVTPPGKRIICGIRHASGVGLDVPLIVDGVNYVHGQHAYVRRLLQLANEKMCSNDVKLRRLEAAVAARLREKV